MPKRINLRRHRPQRVRQEHGAEARRRHYQANQSALVKVEGRISALIELGAGFHPENLRRGRTSSSTASCWGSPRARSRTGSTRSSTSPNSREFIDAPVKTYSSGMYMRLGFAVAIHVDPDVLLVDEVLAVGDEGFTHKCLDKFAEFRRRNKTILLVTHSLGLVERFCDEAVWIDEGRMMGHGNPKRMVDMYLTAVEAGEEQLLATTTAKAVEAASGRRGRTASRRRRDPARHVSGAVRRGRVRPG
ncbi:MAG: hypothetical protein QM736_06945 [Vicinamibacterales bacterium]